MGVVRVLPDFRHTAPSFEADEPVPFVWRDLDELSRRVDVYGWETSLWKKIKGYLGF